MLTIAGAASGFGRAITHRFVAEGAKVIAADMNEEGLAKSFGESPQPHVLTITANVTSESDWKRMVDVAKDKFGGVDIVVNNAGSWSHEHAEFEIPDITRNFVQE